MVSKTLLMLGALESVPIKVHLGLWGSAGALSGGVLPGPLRGKLSRGHLLRRHICKVSSQGNAILKQNQAKTAYNSLQRNTNINVNLEQTYTSMHMFFWDAHIFTHTSLRRYIYEHRRVQDIFLPIPTYRRIQSIFATYIHIYAYSKYFC